MPFDRGTRSGKLQPVPEEPAPVVEEAEDEGAAPAADELEAVLNDLEAERKETRDDVLKGQKTLERIARKR